MFRLRLSEALKAIGGVKTCPYCKGYGDGDSEDMGVPCGGCEGTGQVLDLAPLLAKPKELHEAVRDLILLNADKIWKEIIEGAPSPFDLYVVGPQRAHSLVYEVARQLGGTAVVAISHYRSKPDEFVYDTLSLPIPDNATVLFVTDRLDSDDTLKELLDVITAARGLITPVNDGKRFSVLPYALTLVSRGSGGMQIDPDLTLKVISLHQEGV